MLTVDEILTSGLAADARHDRVGVEGAFALLRERHPENILGYLKGGVYARDAGQHDVADAIFEKGLIFCCDKFPLSVNYAWTAFYKLDWNVSLTRWQHVIAEFPGEVVGYTGVANCYLRMGKLEAAEAVLIAMPANIATDRDVAILQAQIFSARCDWPAAHRFWTDLMEKYPEHTKVIEGFGNALMQLHLLSLEQPLNADEVEIETERSQFKLEVGFVEDPSVHSLVSQFESLGSNCEFGFVQRRMGAEPIGLLRWTDVPADHLAAMLVSRFVGLGEPDCTDIMLVEWGEYMIFDRKYGLGIHTFVTEHQGDPNDILEKHSSRIRRHRDQLIKTLDEGTQIFVYKESKSESHETIQAVHASIQSYGYNTLLWVRQADHCNLPGSVQDMGRGLLLAYIERLSPVLESSRLIWNIPFDQWLLICEESVRIRETVK